MGRGYLLGRMWDRTDARVGVGGLCGLDTFSWIGVSTMMDFLLFTAAYLLVYALACKIFETKNRFGEPAGWK